MSNKLFANNIQQGFSWRNSWPSCFHGWLQPKAQLLIMTYARGIASYPFVAKSTFIAAKSATITWN